MRTTGLGRSRARSNEVTTTAAPPSVSRQQSQRRRIGSVHVQAGDYYGRPVNLASRLTAIAKPGSVLLDGAAKRAAGDGFEYSYAGEKRLKGFDSRTKLHRARRPEGE